MPDTARVTTLAAAMGDYPHTAPLKSGSLAAPGLALAFTAFPTIYRAFKPMIREAAFDVSEMAIVTALQAIAHRKPFILLPVALSARFQEGALLCRADSPIRTPADLAGRHVAVRAYTQTTGMWIRGILADDYALAPDALRWTTFEDAHVPEYRDPLFVTRAAPGADMTAMLRDGTVDAAIFGQELPAGPEFRTVFADPAAAGAAFLAKHGFMPVNHLVLVRQGLAPAILAALMRLLRAAGAPLAGRAALQPAIDLAIRHCVRQGLLDRPLAPAEVWAGLPKEPDFA